jgi:hypothetical protein
MVWTMRPTGCTARTTGRLDTSIGVLMKKSLSPRKLLGRQENQTASSTVSTTRTKASTNRCSRPLTATLRRNSCATSGGREQVAWRCSRNALKSGEFQSVRKSSHKMYQNNCNCLLGDIDNMQKAGVTSANYTYNLKVL